MLRSEYKVLTQITAFLIGKSGGTLNKMKALKLVWAADRVFKTRYATDLIRTEYVAMKNGPVSSEMKKLIEFNPFLDSKVRGYASNYFEPSGRYNLKSINECDMDYLSPKVSETLDLVWDNLGHLDKYELSNYSHQFKEWSNKESLLNSITKTVPMQSEDFFTNHPENSEDFFFVSEEVLKESKEVYLNLM